MKFDVIIGNPPYQFNNRSIYQKFIDRSIEIEANTICMIVKNSWITCKNLDDTKNKILDFGLKTLINYPSPYDIFPEVHVSVNIFKLVKGFRDLTDYEEYIDWQKVNELKTRFEIDKPMLISSQQLNILDKVTNAYDFIPFELARNPRAFSIGSNGRFMLANETIDCIKYTDEKIKDTDVEVIFLDSSKNTYSKFTPLDELPKGTEYVDLYKVVCGSKVGDNESVLTNLNLLHSGQIMTNSFSIFGMVNTEYEANSLLKYAKTKFCRQLIRIAVYGVRVTFGPGITYYLPMQNFTDTSDIDWTQSVNDIDRQLYKKYDLSKDEIEYIENNISQIN